MIRNIQRVLLLLLLSYLSGCAVQVVERSADIKPTKSTFKKIVVLKPDFYKIEKGKNDIYKNEKAIKLEKRLVNSFKRAAGRNNVSIVVPGIDDTMDAEYFNKVDRLEKEMTLTSYILSLNNKNEKLNKPVKEPLATNLILSPDLQSLQMKYGTPYFLYTIVVDEDGLFVVSVLADVSTGKIIYRELKGVLPMKAKGANLDMLVFDSFNELLSWK